MVLRLRMRRVLRWVGAGLSGALLVVWGSSYVAPGQVCHQGMGVHCTKGDAMLFVAVERAESRGNEWVRQRLACLTDRVLLQYAFIHMHMAHLQQGLHVLFVPLWIPFLAFGVPSLVLWWLDRRRPTAGHCPHCGYNLTGNVSGRCPECGNAAPVAAHPEPIPTLRQL